VKQVWHVRPRVSILNLLLVTTIVALAIVVLRLYGELAVERSRRLQLLQKGGILQVTDPDAVHVVQVSALWEPDTLRWRVYVPDRRSVTLNARLGSVAASKASTPRLPPNAIVVAERAPSNPIELGPGEHVVSLCFGSNRSPDSDFGDLRLDIVGDGSRERRIIRSQDEDSRSRDHDIYWIRSGYRDDITHVEHTAMTGKELREGRTVALVDGKTFVLCRLREPTSAWIPTAAARGKRIQTPRDETGELLIWLHPNDG
jgi:hypothetical protein